MPQSSTTAVHSSQLAFPTEVSLPSVKQPTLKKLSYKSPTKGNKALVVGKAEGATLGDMLAIKNSIGQDPARDRHDTMTISGKQDQQAVPVHLPSIPPRPSEAFLTGGAEPIEQGLAARDTAKLRLKHNTMLKLLHNAGPTDDPVKVAKWNDNAGSPTDRSAWQTVVNSHAEKEGSVVEPTPSRNVSDYTVIDENVSKRMDEISTILKLGSTRMKEREEARLANQTQFNALTPVPMMSPGLSPAPSIKKNSRTPLLASRSKKNKPQPLTPEPQPVKFSSSGKVMARNHPTGVELHRKREQRRREEAEAEAIANDKLLQRQARDGAKLEKMKQQMELYLTMIDDQDAQAAKIARTGGGRRTAQTVIGEWKEAAAGYVDTEETIERKQIERHQRKLEREERAEQKKAEAIALSVKLRAAGKKSEDPLLALEKEKKESTTLKKRWRVMKNIGDVEIFSKPQLSALPIGVVQGGEVLEELGMEYRGDIVWVHTNVGWIISQLVYNGVMKVQLSPEADTQHTNIKDFMFDQLDESTVQVERALDACPLDRMKGQSEVRDLVYNAELHRQRVRELPGGHHDFIKQTWHAMQQRSRHQRRILLEQAKWDKAGKSDDSD